MSTVRETREVQRIAPATGPSDAPAGKQGDHPRTIGVLDNETTLLELVGGELAAEGYEVLVCTDKRTFLRKMPGLKVDLIITDVDGPGMSGLEFLGQIRKRKKWKTLPVIVASGMGAIVESEAKLQGAFEVFQKPYAIEDLLEAIRRALSRQWPADHTQ